MERTKTMGWKTFMSLLLALCMALTLLSVQAFAASEADPGDTDPEETELLPDPPEQEVEPVPVVVDVLGVELPDCDVVYNGSNQPYPYAELFTGLEGVKSVDISYTEGTWTQSKKMQNAKRT